MSESVISYLEVPKIALLRLIAGLIAIFWSIEWALKNFVNNPSHESTSAKLTGIYAGIVKLPSLVAVWLQFHPMRWFLVTVCLFFGSTLLSTVLSGSFSNSMWGEIPGEDGYSAYTIACYGILFGVIATHLRTSSQLMRLICATVLMGSLTGTYGIFQHYGNDFLNLSEITGGSPYRVTIFMGNAIFAAALLSMTIPISLVAATIVFREKQWGEIGLLFPINQLTRDFILTTGLALILSVQILGLIFTFSRGPWGGTTLAVLVLLGLIAPLMGWRLLIRIVLVLGLACIFAISFLQFQEDISIGQNNILFGTLTSICGLLITFCIMFLIPKLTRTAHWMILTGGIIAVASIGVMYGSSLSVKEGSTHKETVELSDSAQEQTFTRISSIKPQVLGGFSEGRGTHWKVSWELIKNRPWFAFDELGLNWARPIIGYGPDLFRYTYLLKSTPDEHDSLVLEPDHAHNFFIHQAVEQGLLGGFASLALFISLFGILCHHLINKKTASNSLYRIVLIGFTAIVIGRFLEMMVGVARVSDLTVLWVIFGVLAASWKFNSSFVEARGINEQIQNGINADSNTQTRQSLKKSTTRVQSNLMLRLIVVIGLTAGLAILTWHKGINPVRAAIQTGSALESFQEGNLKATVDKLDYAIELVPEIPYYHNNKAQVFLTYQMWPNAYTETSCAQNTKILYSKCVGLKRLASHQNALKSQPFHFRSRLGVADSLSDLGHYFQAQNAYEKSLSMVPNSYHIHNSLARTYLMEGSYHLANEAISASLDITKRSIQSREALFLKGQALSGMGEFTEAEATLLYGLSLEYDSPSTQESLDLIRAINSTMGTLLSVNRFDSYIEQPDGNAGALYLRGLTHLILGNTNDAVRDIGTSIGEGLVTNDVKANYGYAQLKHGIVGDIGELNSLISTDPYNPLYNAYYADYLISKKLFRQALGHANTAIELDPYSGLAHLIRAKALTYLGDLETAKQSLVSSSNLKLPSSTHYVELGELHYLLEEYQMAIANFDKAIQINPNKSRFYNARARAYIASNDPLNALRDFDSAIHIHPQNSNYLINRAVLHNLSGDLDQSLRDLSDAKSLDSSSLVTSAIEKIGALNNLEQAVGNANFESLTSTPDELLVSYYNRTSQDYISVSQELSAFSGIRPWPNFHQSFDHPHKSISNEIIQTYLKLDEWTLALQYLDSQNFAIDPLDNTFYELRGIAYTGLGEYDKAQIEFDNSLRLNPTASITYKERGYLNTLSGNHSQGFSDFKQALNLTPNDHDIYYKRALAHSNLGDYELALIDLESALTLDPENQNYIDAKHYGYYKLGLTYSNDGNSNLALAHFDLALELDPSNASYLDAKHTEYFKRSLIYSERGFSKLALEDINSAISLAPTNSDYLYVRGTDYFKSDQTTLALLDFVTAISTKYEEVYRDPGNYERFWADGKIIISIGDVNYSEYDVERSKSVLDGGLEISDWIKYQRPYIDVDDPNNVEALKELLTLSPTSSGEDPLQVSLRNALKHTAQSVIRLVEDTKSVNKTVWVQFHSTGGVAVLTNEFGYPDVLKLGVLNDYGKKSDGSGTVVLSVPEDFMQMKKASILYSSAGDWPGSISSEVQSGVFRWNVNAEFKGKFFNTSRMVTNSLDSENTLTEPIKMGSLDISDAFIDAWPNDVLVLELNRDGSNQYDTVADVYIWGLLITYE